MSAAGKRATDTAKYCSYSSPTPKQGIRQLQPQQTERILLAALSKTDRVSQLHTRLTANNHPFARRPQICSQVAGNRVSALSNSANSHVSSLTAQKSGRTRLHGADSISAGYDLRRSAKPKISTLQILVENNDVSSRTLRCRADDRQDASHRPKKTLATHRQNIN